MHDWLGNIEMSDLRKRLRKIAGIYGRSTHSDAADRIEELQAQLDAAARANERKDASIIKAGRRYLELQEQVEKLNSTTGRKDLNDLFLHYRFTDRGGVDVFDVYLAADAKKRLNKLGQFRNPVLTLSRKAMLREDHQVDTWDPAEPYPDEPGFKKPTVQGDGTG